MTNNSSGGPPQNSRGGSHNNHAPSARQPAAAGSSAPLAVSRFLRSLQVLLRAARLYTKNHPKELESLESTERDLRAALRFASPLGVIIEPGAILFRGQPLADQRGELKALAEGLARYGIHTLSFSSETHLGELGAFSRLFPAPGNPPPADWRRLLEEHRLSAIAVNAPIEDRRADANLTSLVALLLGPEVTAGVAGEAPSTPSSVEDLVAFAQLQARIVRPLQQAAARPPLEAAQTLRALFSAAEPRAARALVAAMNDLPPWADEPLPDYFFRQTVTLAQEFVRNEMRAGRLRVVELRDLFSRLGRELCAALPMLLELSPGGTKWNDESCAAHLQNRFWRDMEPRDKAEVLHGSEAWCMPLEPLRDHLEKMMEAGGEREARHVLLNYARGLESEMLAARLAVAIGLSELAPVLERLWPAELPGELGRGIVRALLAESAPEVAGVLSASVDQLARLAIRNLDFAEFERMLDALESAPRGTRHAHLGALARGLLNDQRWDALTEAAMAHHHLHSSLPRILARDPDRLIDRLSARLNGGPEAAKGRGLEELPAMARLLRVIGEPAVGALVTRLFDPRTPRATAAAKLLSATAPARLLEALPRAIANWDWNLQDMVVGELVRLAVPGAAATLLDSLAHAHALVVPMMLDEIGLAKETRAVPMLIEIAAGRQQGLADVFVRIKAVEALGRLRALDSADMLRKIVRERDGLTHTEPAGLRAAAEEALGLVENRPSSARVRTAHAAVEKAGVAFPRPRRYLRIPLESPLAARMHPSAPRDFPPAGTPSEGIPARVTTISLGGAFLQAGVPMHIGDSVGLEIKTGLRSIAGTAVVRNIAAGGGGVEFVHMKQDDREKLRRLVNRLLKD